MLFFDVDLAPNVFRAVAPLRHRPAGPAFADVLVRSFARLGNLLLACRGTLRLRRHGRRRKHSRHRNYRDNQFIIWFFFISLVFHLFLDRAQSRPLAQSIANSSLTGNAIGISFHAILFVLYLI